MTNTTQTNGNMTDQQAMSALKQHGTKIVWAIVVALGAFFGYQYYQKHYAKIDTVAADAYTAISERGDVLNVGYQNPDLDDNAKAKLSEEQQALFVDIDRLVVEHGKSVYAWQALLLKARYQADGEHYGDAATTLRQALTMDLGDEGLMALTTLRLGQVLLADGKSDEALSVANSTMPEAFLPSRQELLGDIYVAKDDPDNAKVAYQSAWDELTKRGNGRSLLSLKMQALGMTHQPIAPKNPVVAQPDATSQDMVATVSDIAD